MTVEETIYAPPPGPPPSHRATYAPPPGPPPPQWQPRPFLPAYFPLLSPHQINSLRTQGYTTFPIEQRPALHNAASSLFRVSRTFFAQPQTIKNGFQVLAANDQGSEEGWSRVVGEKELLTLRKGGPTCPPAVESQATALWKECGALMQQMVRGIEQSLGMPQCAFDNVVIPECTMPREGGDRVETLLRMFRYERRSEADDAAAPHEDEASGKGRLVSEPHRDLGLLSLVIGASPGLEVFDSAVGDWVPIEQPPYAGPGLTATLLVGETLTRLTNGQYAPGRHRVFVPSSLSPADDDSQYRYSLVFALRPHANAIISTPALTTPVTGTFHFPLIDIRARELFAAIARSHWNVNTGHRTREAQRVRLQKGNANIPPVANEDSEIHRQEAEPNP
ncbi:hypothetical protein JB92DRAFT_2911679 [Gautieria morchelliformis]|nr:hypothetical protein JB92DRAFT_2911679 [Gautieria morchelliformis]